MTLIEALLLLPERGGPKVVNREVAEALTGSSAKIVQRHGPLWSLTEGGRRFLAQFRYGRSDTVTQIVVRLVIEDDALMFHLHCDEGRPVKVPRTDLRRSLEVLQSVNPGVKVVFDFRRSPRVG